MSVNIKFGRGFSHIDVGNTTVAIVAEYVDVSDCYLVDSQSKVCSRNHHKVTINKYIGLRSVDNNIQHLLANKIQRQYFRQRS